MRLEPVMCHGCLYSSMLSKALSLSLSQYLYWLSARHFLALISSLRVAHSSRRLDVSDTLPKNGRTCRQQKYIYYHNKIGIFVGFESVYEGQWLRARLCCRKLSDSILWLFCFTPRWLAGAMPCPKKAQKKYKKGR